MTEEMGANKKINSPDGLDLGKALSPIWKSTYYLGLTFDWCRRIPKRSRASFIAQCLIILASLVFLTCYIVLSALKVGLVIRNPHSKSQDCIIQIILFDEQPLILFIWLYFLIRKADIQAFFEAWANLEKQPVKGIHVAQIKRTSIFVYIAYYTYGLFFLIIAIFTENDDLMSNYYPSLASYAPYVFIIKIKDLVYTFLYAVFYPMTDIVPTFIYYHAAEIVESMKFEILELISTNDEASESKEGIVYSVWSRLEDLIVVIRRADKLFGDIVIICQGMLFFNICCCVYLLFSIMIQNTLIVDSPDDLPMLLTCLLFYPSRLGFIVCFMSKLHKSSGQLLTAVAHFNLKCTFYVNEGERRVVQSLLSRLGEVRLAAHPSGFYKIKPSVFLTLLSLIVTYTIILLQTNGSTNATNSPYLPKNNGSNVI